jgi:hypothetical protein
MRHSQQPTNQPFPVLASPMDGCLRQASDGLRGGASNGNLIAIEGEKGRSLMTEARNIIIRLVLLFIAIFI